MDPEIAHFISIRQVSFDAATLHVRLAAVKPTAGPAATAAGAADAAVYSQFADYKLIIIN